MCAAADGTSVVLYVPLEFAGSAGNSTTNPSCGWGYSFQAAAAGADAISIAEMAKAIVRMSHPFTLVSMGNSWYKNKSKAGNTIDARAAGLIQEERHGLQDRRIHCHCSRGCRSGRSSSLLRHVRSGKDHHGFRNIKRI